MRTLRGQEQHEAMATNPAPMEAQPTDHLVGRERALVVVERFLDRLAGPAALVVEGNPGIGKTTVWQEGVRLATARGASVLSCRPVQAEVSLAFGGLVDLFEHVADSRLAALPLVQRDALAVALRRRAPDTALPDVLTVSAGARAVILSLAATGPVLLAIDDAQWLDKSTAATLAYVIRRLDHEAVGLFVAHRPEDRVAGDDALAIAAMPTQRIELEPLSLSSLHHVIRARTGLIAPRPLLHRIAESSRGNPFFAIELAKAIVDAGRRPGPGEPLPAPATIVDLTARRIRRVPADTREALLVLASLSAPTLALIEAILGRDPGDSLDAARDEGILEPGIDPPRFAHPLFAESVLRLASQRDRRRIHAEIAGRLDEPEERARHLALTVDPPDAAIAEALEAGATAARSRGALRAAAELLDQACRFTPAPQREAAHRRAFGAAELSILAGDRGSAGVLLREIVGAAGSPLRERAVGLLAEIIANGGGVAEAETLLVEARLSAVLPDVAGRLDLDLAYVSLLRLDPAEAVRCASRARAGLADIGHDALLAEAVAYESLARVLAGLDLDEDALALALRLEDASRPPYMGLPPSGVVGLVRAFTADHAEARRLLTTAQASLDLLGDDCDLAHALLWVSWLELRSGRLPEAASLARQAATMAESTGSELLRAWSVAQAALVEAHRGDRAATDGLILEAIGDGALPGGLVGVWLLAARGLAALGAGDASAAATAFRPLAGTVGRAPLAEPVLGFYIPDAVEAFAIVGEPSLARALLGPFAHAANERGRAWARAVACRAEAAILVSEGAIARAEETLRDAAQRLAGLDLPLERARTLLALGRLERRLGARRAARDTLEAAAALFDAATASGWARVARAELGRVPGRRVEPSVLTPGELRVAELSGGGRTNREVAGLLYLSPKTVEANLARIYRKLGISTRAELGAWVAARSRGDASPIP